MGNTPLHIAATGGYVHLIHPLLAAGADINAKNEKGRTPIFNAVSNQELLAVQTLCCMFLYYSITYNYNQC